MTVLPIKSVYVVPLARVETVAGVEVVVAGEVVREVEEDDPDGLDWSVASKDSGVADSGVAAGSGITGLGVGAGLAGRNATRPFGATGGY